MLKKLSLRNTSGLTIIIFLFFVTSVLALASQLRQFDNLDLRIIGQTSDIIECTTDHHPGLVFTRQGNYCVGSTRYVCVNHEEWEIRENDCGVACREACHQTNQDYMGTCDPSIGGLSGCHPYTGGGGGWGTNCVIRTPVGGPEFPVEDCPETCTCYTGETIATNCTYGCDDNCQCKPADPLPTVAPPELTCPEISRIECRPSGGVIVHWTGVTGGDLYRLFRNTNEVFSSGHRSFADTTAPCGQTLTYRVNVYSVSGASKECYQNAQINCLCPTTDLCPTIVTSSADGEVQISWSLNPEARHYRVYRGQELIEETTDLSCADDDVECGATHWYSVRPVVGASEVDCQQNESATAVCAAAPPGTCEVSLQGEYQPNQEIVIRCNLSEGDDPSLFNYQYTMVKDEAESQTLNCDSSSQECSYLIPDYGCYTFECEASLR